MALAAEALPLPTPLDPAEEPPGSIDPLGTLPASERLADLLLPGFTARMWRARLLTFAATAASIADQVVRLLGGRADVALQQTRAFSFLGLLTGGVFMARSVRPFWTRSISWVCAALYCGHC
jgi:hypothetical protein